MLQVETRCNLLDLLLHWDLVIIKNAFDLLKGVVVLQT